jgi:hypothetical protein
MNIDRKYYGPTDLHVARDLELLARLHSTVEAEEPLATPPIAPRSTSTGNITMPAIPTCFA